VTVYTFDVRPLTDALVRGDVRIQGTTPEQEARVRAILHRAAKAIYVEMTGELPPDDVVEASEHMRQTSGQKRTELVPGSGDPNESGWVYEGDK
jgi:hypothetical protein